MRYLPLSEGDRSAMLSVIGAGSIDDLFVYVPAEARQAGPIPGLPLLIGTSRKSMLGKLLGNEPHERLPATIATNVLAYAQGAHIFRVHDVRPNRDALRVAQATLYGPPEGTR